MRAVRCPVVPGCPQTHLDLAWRPRSAELTAGDDRDRDRLRELAIRLVGVSDRSLIDRAWKALQ